MQSPPPPPSQLSSRRVARKAKAKGSLHDKEGTVRPTHHKETWCATGSTRGGKCKKKKSKYKHVRHLLLPQSMRSQNILRRTGKTPRGTLREQEWAGAAWGRLKVLYVFSGRKRRNSVGGYLRNLSKKHGVEVEVVELDIQRKQRDDFSLQHVQKRWLQRITNGEFFAVTATPPMCTQGDFFGTARLEQKGQSLETFWAIFPLKQWGGRQNIMSMSAWWNSQRT